MHNVDLPLRITWNATKQEYNSSLAETWSIDSEVTQVAELVEKGFQAAIRNGLPVIKCGEAVA